MDTLATSGGSDFLSSLGAPITCPSPSSALGARPRPPPLFSRESRPSPTPLGRCVDFLEVALPKLAAWEPGSGHFGCEARRARDARNQPLVQPTRTGGNEPSRTILGVSETKGRASKCS